MKQTIRMGAVQLAACTVMGMCAVGAHAQSSVKVYGVLDIGIEYNNAGTPGEKAVWRESAGNQYGTRLGFLVTEQINSDLSAEANIETGFSVDNGNTIGYGEATTPMWGRRSVVGLRSKTYGDVMLGRDYTPAFWTVIQTDRFRYGLPGTVSTASGIVVSRANKGIYYTSPNFGGFVAKLLAATSDSTVNRASMFGGSLDYRSGPLFLSVMAQKRKEPSYLPNTGVKEYGLGGEYTFSPYVVSVGYYHADPDTNVAGAVTRSRAMWLGAGVNIGPGQLNAQVARTLLDVNGRAGEGRAMTYGIAYTYPLSKRTALYAGAGRVSNNADARLMLNSGSNRIGGVVYGADPRSFIVGMRHSF